MKKSIAAIFVLTWFGLTACEADKQGLREKATIEGKASGEGSMAAELANLVVRSREMETDLAQRHRFYQALRGVFEGELQTDQGMYRIRVILVPSLHPYITPRTRQLDEIATDLNNLYFNAQVVQWNPANPLSAVGCRVNGIKPDLNNGEISIASDSCANLYSIKIGEEIETSRQLASQIAEGKLDKVVSIVGAVYPSTNAATYHFSIKRSEEK